MAAALAMPANGWPTNDGSDTEAEWWVVARLLALSSAWARALSAAPLPARPMLEVAGVSVPSPLALPAELTASSSGPN